MDAFRQAADPLDPLARSPRILPVRFLACPRSWISALTKHELRVVAPGGQVGSEYLGELRV